MTKASVLQYLQSRDIGIHLLPQVVIHYGDRLKSRDRCLQELSRLNSASFACRSSFSLEDGSSTSNAGAYESYLFVSVEQLVDSIDNVFNSYPTLGPHEEVLVQPMAQGVISSGT